MPAFVSHFITTQHTFVRPRNTYCSGSHLKATCPSPPSPSPLYEAADQPPRHISLPRRLPAFRPQPYLAHRHSCVTTSPSFPSKVPRLLKYSTITAIRCYMRSRPRIVPCPVIWEYHRSLPFLQQPQPSGCRQRRSASGNRTVPSTC